MTDYKINKVTYKVFNNSNSPPIVPLGKSYLVRSGSDYRGNMVPTVKKHIEDEHSDEIVIDEKEKIILHDNDYDVKNTYHVKYDVFTNNDIYNLFLIDINPVLEITSKGFDKADFVSYDLVLQKYVGVSITCHIDLHHLDTKNKKFTIYSKHIKDTKVNLDITKEQIAYYPIYVICEEQYYMEDFLKLYPYLIKNIFKYKF
jgi:hypothetical protein